MNTNIKVTNIELTPAISAYLDDKLSHLERFIVEDAPDAALAEVEIGKLTKHHRSGEVFQAEITLTLKGKTFRAVSVQEDLYAAIDIMKDEIISQLTAAHKRNLTLIKKGGRAIKDMLRGFGLKR
jgi:ribosomal subunit interface protein